MIQFACFVIGFAIGYIILDIYVVKPCHNDYADLTLKNGKEYARHSEIIAKLLQDRENVRDLLLDLGIIKWAEFKTIAPGEVVVVKRSLVVQGDSKIINRLLLRRKNLQEDKNFNDMLFVIGHNGINDYLCRWPDYMENKQ